MAFPDYDYDLYEDFEDALGAGWTEVDPDNNINPQDTDAEYYGVQGMSIDLDGDTANKDIAYIYYDCGVDRTPLSLGFWWHLPSTTDTWWGGDVVCSVGNAAEGNTYCCKVYAQKEGAGTEHLHLRGAAGMSADDIDISPDTWYWITIKAVRNGTCILRVYDTNGDQVGAEIDETGYDLECRYLNFGPSTAWGMSDLGVHILYDEIVVDWTDATFPLLGWETGAPAGNPWYAYAQQQ